MALLGFAMGAAPVARRVRKGLQQAPTRLRRPALGNRVRPRADPDAVTALDVEVMAGLPSLPKKRGLLLQEEPVKEAPRRPRADLTGDEATAADLEGFAGGGIETAALKAGRAELERKSQEAREAMARKMEDVAEEQEDMQSDTLAALLKDMDDVARADLVEKYTRSAMVLMEAGEIEQATKELARVRRIADLFMKLEGIAAQPTPEKKTGSGMSKEEWVLFELRRELAKEDFRAIFGGDARLAFLIGSWT